MALALRFLNWSRPCHGFYALFSRSSAILPIRYSSAVTSQAPHSSMDEFIQRAERLAKDYTEYMDEMSSRWIKNNEIYYGKMRDFEKFPTLTKRMWHPAVRFGVFPDTWFQALYPKTGVTGPYVLFYLSILFLLNKELLIMGGESCVLMHYFLWFVILSKTFGPMLREYTDKHEKANADTYYEEPKRVFKGHLDRLIEYLNQELVKASGFAELLKAREDFIHLQLEADYRWRLEEVYRTVKRRLDYHVERESVRLGFVQRHMSNWIVDNVVKGITPAQEKETLAQCINEIKRLAQQSKAASHT